MFRDSVILKLMKKKTSVKSSNFLQGFIIFSFLLLVTTGLYLFQKSQMASQKNIQIVQNNFETYTDSTLNFSIEYPENIVIYRTFPEGGVEFMRREDSKKDFNEITTLAVYLRNGDTPELALESECSKPCVEKYDPVTVNNAVGIKTLGPSYNENNYYLQNINTKKIVRVFIGIKGDQKENIDDFKKMINTFKFVE